MHHNHLWPSMLLIAASSSLPLTGCCPPCNCSLQAPAAPSAPPPPPPSEPVAPPTSDTAEPPPPPPPPEPAADKTKFYCFEVFFPDGDRNSECTKTREKCERNMETMQGYTTPGSVFNGCVERTEVYCYPAVTDALCFTTRSDCEASRAIIPGGSCSVSE